MKSWELGSNLGKILNSGAWLPCPLSRNANASVHFRPSTTRMWNTCCEWRSYRNFMAFSAVCSVTCWPQNTCLTTFGNKMSPSREMSDKCCFFTPRFTSDILTRLSGPNAIWQLSQIEVQNMRTELYKKKRKNTIIWDQNQIEIYCLYNLLISLHIANAVPYSKHHIYFLTVRGYTVLDVVSHPNYGVVTDTYTI